MPKRPNPWGEITPLQLKSHIGLKELSRGVSGEEVMKEVYEHTQKLLFEGAKREADLCRAGMANNSGSGDHRCLGLDMVNSTRQCQIPPGQAILDNNCQIAGVISGNDRDINNSCQQKHVGGVDIPMEQTLQHHHQQSTLTRFGFVTGSPAKSEPMPESCPHCKSTLPLIHCEFCSTQFCRSCLQACENCSGLFCSARCLEMNYSGTRPMLLCRHCYHD